MQFLVQTFRFLIFPGILYPVFAGLLLSGIDRKLVGRMQHRVGAPIMQNFWDIVKLWGKETIVPREASRRVFLAAPVAGVAAILSCALLIPVFGNTVLPMRTDVIVVLYLLTLASVAIIVGGAASASPFAGVGLSRMAVSVISYELPMVLALLAVCMAAGQERASFSLAQIAACQTVNGGFLFNWRLIPAALAMLLVIPCEVGSSPFDVGEAGIEICEGPLAEYGGRPLALFKLQHAVKVYVMSALFVALFLGGTATGLLLTDCVLHLLLTAAVTVFSMTLCRALCARLRVEQLFRFYWGPVTLLSLVSLILVWIF